MKSSELYSALLGDLVAIRDNMMTTEWTDAVSKADSKTQVDAFRTAFAVQHAVNVLSNASLGDIASEMVAQEGDIVSATKELQASLKKLQQVSTVLESIASVLAVVAQVVALV